ncbi:hypothetical protein NUU61_000089 [Penicillium alfredii]|uniref:Uncharacterized protein n=1 Tax=Penicillium alfredii TaxID=1506179 RepID=A0A9W9KQA8_9EURO|nr:uncharacterized protein NUU61_000089 [Penicillium alfredii]KAJ5114330.1 hypothetical protein NUU61_000089 [Penicillium alfredii]
MAPSGPLRVLVIVSQRSPLLAKARDSPGDLLPVAVQLLKSNNVYSTREESLPQTKLLAMQIFRTRIFFVFDIANASYNARLGHLPEHNQIPVAVVHFSKKRSAYAANPWVSRRVNRDIALLHNANGFGAVPPFVEDHTLGKPPQYLNPRDLSLF